MRSLERWTLTASIIGSAVVFLDSTIVTVARPCLLPRPAFTVVTTMESTCRLEEISLRVVKLHPEPAALGPEGRLLRPEALGPRAPQLELEAGDVGARVAAPGAAGCSPC